MAGHRFYKQEKPVIMVPYTSEKKGVSTLEACSSLCLNTPGCGQVFLLSWPSWPLGFRSCYMFSYANYTCTDALSSSPHGVGYKFAQWREWESFAIKSCNCADGNRAARLMDVFEKICDGTYSSPQEALASNDDDLCKPKG